MNDQGKNVNKTPLTMKILIAIEAVLALFAILFVRPHPYDMTVEMILSVWPDSDPGVFVHTVLPVFLYPVFYIAWHFMARRLAPKHQALFLSVVYAFYFMNIFIDGY
ncbi:MAG: hypothetical protein J6N76_02920, partial [Lachnospiraceae bacterium]|nr:hypothetical protein [Lachnospiraceae bacterium]